MISLQKLLQWILHWWRKDDHKERGSLSSAVIQKYHHCFPTFSGDEFVTRCFFHEYDNSFTLYIRYVFWPSVACGIGTNVDCANKQEVINDIKNVRVSDHSDLKYLLTKVYFPFHFLKKLAEAMRNRLAPVLCDHSTFFTTVGMAIALPLLTPIRIRWPNRPDRTIEQNNAIRKAQPVGCLPYKVETRFPNMYLNI